MAGARVRLEPIDPEVHAESLYALSHGPDMAWLWDYMAWGPFADLADFTGWLEGCAGTADPLSFAVIDLRSGRASGMASYMNIVPADGRIEVGQIWYAPPIQRTPLPTEAMFLMFGQGVRRARLSPPGMEVQRPQRALQAGRKAARLHL